MLVSATRSSSLSSLPWWRRRANYVGVDIGVDRVTIATLDVHSSSDAAKISMGPSWRFGLSIDPSGEPPSDWVDRVCIELSDKLPRCLDGDCNVCVISLPLPWIHYQVCPASELASVREQCDQMFASSLFQSGSYVRHWPAGANSECTMVAATADQAASQIAGAIANVGYRVDAILPQGVALLHAAKPLTSLRPSAIVLLEPTGGLVAVSEPSSCGLCRSLAPFSSSGERALQLDELEPWLQETSSEIEATLAYALRSGSSVDTESPLMICGELAGHPGVDSLLAGLTHRKVATWRFAGAGSNAEGEAASAVALSLAFAAIDSDELHQSSDDLNLGRVVR